MIPQAHLSGEGVEEDRLGFGTGPSSEERAAGARILEKQYPRGLAGKEASADGGSWPCLGENISPKTATAAGTESSHFSSTLVEMEVT